MTFNPISLETAQRESDGWADDSTFLSEIIETQRDLAAVELDPHVIVVVVAQRMQKLTRADGATILLVEGDHLVCRAGTGIMEAHRELKLPLDSSLAGEAVRAEVTKYSGDSENDPRVDRSSALRVGLRSMVAVPLTQGAQVIGVIQVVSRKPNAFTSRDVAALRLMTGLVSASLTHASEFEIKKSLLAAQTESYAALRSSELRFQCLFEHATDAVFVHDIDGRFLDVNRLACSSLGYTRSELVGLSVRDIDDAWNRERSSERWSRPDAAEPLTIQRTHRRRDGSTFPVEIRAALIEHGLQKAVLCLVRDISSRIAAEAALRESQERFRTAFEHAVIGMALVALDGRWLQVNRSLCEIVGYTQHELLASDFQSITHPPDLEADLNSVRRLISGEIPDYQMVKRYVHQQGHIIAVHLGVSLVRSESGAPLYFVAQIQDIAQRVHAAQVLRERTRAEWLERDRGQILESLASHALPGEVFARLAEAVELQLTGSVAAILVLNEDHWSVFGSAALGDWGKHLRSQRLTLVARLAGNAWLSPDRCGVTQPCSDNIWEALQPAALDAGLFACWTFCIAGSTGQTQGLLTVFTRESRKPTPAEVQTIDFAANLASMCIERSRR